MTLQSCLKFTTSNLGQNSPSGIFIFHNKNISKWHFSLVVERYYYYIIFYIYAFHFQHLEFDPIYVWIYGVLRLDSGMYVCYVQCTFRPYEKSENPSMRNSFGKNKKSDYSAAAILKHRYIRLFYFSASCTHLAHIFLFQWRKLNFFFHFRGAVAIQIENWRTATKKLATEAIRNCKHIFFVKSKHFIWQSTFNLLKPLQGSFEREGLPFLQSIFPSTFSHFSSGNGWT